MAGEIELNKIFLGCNYSNKKVKKHFDGTKLRIEKNWPIRVVLIDREKAKGAKDLWKEITTAISDCSLAIFDVSGFRPNVILELGYALATKDVDNILITFDERKSRGGKKPEWLLSDIAHLNQIRYKELGALERKIEEQLDRVPIVARFKAFMTEAQGVSTSHAKYCEIGLKILQMMRDKGTISDQQIISAARGSAIRVATLNTMLKKHKLATRARGPNGRWKLPLI